MLQNSPVVPYIPASNLARARKFYEEKLGLKPAMEANGGLVYTFGNGSEAFMYVSPGAGTSQASQLFWNVKDVKAEVAELKARGVVFEEYDFPGMKMEGSIATGGGAMAAWFKDSEGNIMAVVQSI
ncbi:MAG: VOC family protein [Gemmatimonadota bacterium]|nr:VOC family protein [Gemmatimonadota bacterium]